MKASILYLTIFILSGALSAENVDPYEVGEQFGYSENTGWLNAEPNTGDGMQVECDKVTGFVWGENIGWINLHCENNGTCGTVSYGVVNDGAGNLSGFGWAENVGWINFDPDVPGDTTNQYQVSIDEDGKLSGWAWGENIGWIHFDETKSWERAGLHRHAGRSDKLCLVLASIGKYPGKPGRNRSCGYERFLNLQFVLAGLLSGWLAVEINFVLYFPVTNFK